MQSFNTESDDAVTPVAEKHELIVGAIAEIQPGSCTTIELSDGDQVAVFNVGGEFYAIENFCPHKGAPLSEG
ncbi:MAG TPA: Rieske 2Fe-2S domain-containing protein, partial [Pyrinomonadaceae bacterium]|nr:Rieske 2Fe-2S domain-containing protein [Pyrinomonadaceae bacterium]